MFLLAQLEALGLSAWGCGIFSTDSTSLQVPFSVALSTTVGDWNIYVPRAQHCLWKMKVAGLTSLTQDCEIDIYLINCLQCLFLPQTKREKPLAAILLCFVTI